jgi:hypothetical protein
MDRKPVSITIFLAVSLCLAGCDLISGTPRILGRWEVDDKPGQIIEFRSDGTVVIKQDDQQETVVDYFIDYDKQPILLTIDEDQETVEFTDRDHVTLTDPLGAKLNFHRIK